MEIVEILQAAKQGRSTPFLCRGEDECLYYVKGKNGGRRSQFYEWTLAHLATKFGLPMPVFRLVNISRELLAETTVANQIIGEGIAFATEAQTRAQWFERGFVESVSKELRRDILAFDWWVHNVDRLEDNPNLLWDTNDQKLIVIDHNYAFGEDFWPSFFRDHHIFACESEELFDDLAHQAEYSQRMNDSLSVWTDACDTLPDQWLNSQSGQEVDEINILPATDILNRCNDADFWKLK